ncbi:MAG TPA: efflux RND transporter periplasmic adaptor subunit [Clostridia bacterium]|nr:efflux RND transporter periplasmic adaptor subunit [Clostridia bacterium]
MEQLQLTEQEEKTPAKDDNSIDTQQELLALLGKKRRSGLKKYLPFAIAILLLLVAVILWRLLSKNNTQTDAVNYRQYTVQRGDVIVGSSESSSISLSREVVKFPVSTTVEQVYVKAGQSVKEGDPLMQLNVDEIKAGMVSYQLQVKMAELELGQSKLDQQTKLLKAEQTYNSAILQGQLAESSQSVTITQLEKQLADAQEELEDALETLNTYQDYDDNYDDDYSDLQALARRVATYKSLYQEYYSRYQEVSQLETDLATWQELYDNLSNEEKAKTDDDSNAKSYLEKIATLQGQIGDDTSTALYKSYQNAYETYQTYNSKYADRLADFNEEYDVEYGDDDALSDKIETLKKKVESYNIALENAKLSQQTGTLSAEQAKQLTELAAQTAEAQYNLTTIQLSQAVDQKQETYDQTVRQINSIQKSISDNGIVYAPCTGMIVSVSLEEGDDFDVTYDEDTDTLNEQTLLTMTDISSVYVPITISEEDILNVYIGQPASVTMSAFEGVTFDAEVDTVSVEAARSGAATVSYTVNVKYADVNTLDMYEGMSAQTTLLQRVAKDVLYINNQAVINQNGIATVQKLDSEGNTVTVTVKTGFSNGQYVEIISGLEEGETVLAASGVSKT